MISHTPRQRAYDFLAWLFDQGHGGRAFPTRVLAEILYPTYCSVRFLEPLDWDRQVGRYFTEACGGARSITFDERKRRVRQLPAVRRDWLVLP